MQASQEVLSTVSLKHGNDKPDVYHLKVREYESAWKTTAPVPLSTESLMDLLESRTPLLKQAGFISTEVAKKMEVELESRFKPYLNDSGTSLDKVGVSQFEFQAQSQEDFTNRTGLGMF